MINEGGGSSRRDRGPILRTVGTGWSTRALIGGITAVVAAAALLIAGIGALAVPRWNAFSAPAAIRGGAQVVGPATATAPDSAGAASHNGLWPLPEACFTPAALHKPTARDHALLDGDSREVVVTAYPVRRGNLGAETAGHGRTCDSKLWKVVRAVYPAKALALIDRFIVFDGTPDDDTLGEVRPDNAVDTRWTLLIRYSGVADSTLALTLVHELGHLLSLNPSQADPAPEPADGCDTYPTGMGCSLPGSIMDEYMTQTWSQRLVDQWFAIDVVNDDKARQAKLDDFYRQNSASFVDSYAATDPDEDFAETFAYWCLGGTLLTPQLAAKATFLTERPETAGMPKLCQLLASSGVPDLS